MLLTLWFNVINEQTNWSAIDWIRIRPLQLSGGEMSIKKKPMKNHSGESLSEDCAQNGGTSRTSRTLTDNGRWGYLMLKEMRQQMKDLICLSVGRKINSLSMSGLNGSFGFILPQLQSPVRHTLCNGTLAIPFFPIQHWTNAEWATNIRPSNQYCTLIPIQSASCLQLVTELSYYCSRLSNHNQVFCSAFKCL